ncbi:MAG: hypothetical protein KIS96_07605 [Bauldia sp.]|nr:hypothetical protein [Bauldia sp.]
MAAAAKRKLKVFQTSIGFYDVLVATSGKAAALRAWGIHQDLFAQGLASQVTDASLVDAALAHPETVLRRAIGSKGGFSVDPSPPRIKRTARREESEDEESRAPEPEPEPADRSKLTAAEEALAALDADHDRDTDRIQRELAAVDAEEAKLVARRRALNAEATAKRKVWQDHRAKAETTLQSERRAYRDAGGRD